jgi:multidrug efflux pump subunit AcrA (membrane-fusion protein)
VQTAERAQRRAQLQAELAAAAVQSATIRLTNRQILAPIDGIVTSIHARPGQWVEAGKPVCVISELKYVQVDCLIPIEKVDLQRVVGLEVRVQSDRLPTGGKPIRLAGRISSYDPKLSSQGEVRVHARIQNVEQQGHWMLLPGMTVNLEVSIPGNDSPALISRQPGKTR